MLQLRSFYNARYEHRGLSYARYALFCYVISGRGACYNPSSLFWSLSVGSVFQLPLQLFYIYGTVYFSELKIFMRSILYISADNFVP